VCGAHGYCSVSGVCGGVCYCSMARSETLRAALSALSLVSVGDQKILDDSSVLLGAFKKQKKNLRQLPTVE